MQQQNRFAIVYDEGLDPKLRLAQVSDNLDYFPDSVKVGDLLKGKPIVALATAQADLEEQLLLSQSLCAKGNTLYAQMQPLRRWRYYTVFRFYVTNPQYAVSVEDKVEIALLGETQTVRVIGHDDPDELDTKCVWEHLAQFETPSGTVFKGGPQDGAEASRFRSLDTIDTDTNRYWKPLPTSLIDNPCPTITVDATAV